MESPPAPASARWRRLGPGPILVGVLLLAFGLTIGPFLHACAGGSDSSGYLNQARLLAAGRVHLAPRVLAGLDGRHFSEFLYAPLGFVPRQGSLVPTYPIGLPLCIAALAPVVGWTHAADAAILLHALAGLLVTYLLGRAVGLGWRGATVGAAALALSPLYIDFSVQLMSDMPALAWTTAAGWSAWRCRGRAGAGAIVTGVLLGMATLVRPTDALLIFPIAIAWWPSWRHALLGALGTLPGALVFLAYNRIAYGSPLTTGYGAAGSLFHLSFVWPTLRHYAHWVPAVLSPAVWLFLLLPWCRSRAAAFLLVWAAVFLGFYATYQFTRETWWYLRFVLPAFPPLIAGATLGLKRLLAAWPRRLAAGPAARTGLGLLAVLWLAHREVRWTRQFGALFAGMGERNYPLSMDWLQAYAPHDAILLCMQTSGSAFYYTDFTILRWDEIGRDRFSEVAQAAARAGRPLYAPLYPYEQEPALRERLPGLWQPATRIGDVTIWQWRGDARSR